MILTLSLLYMIVCIHVYCAWQWIIDKLSYSFVLTALFINVAMLLCCQTDDISNLLNNHPGDLDDNYSMNTL